MSNQRDYTGKAPIYQKWDEKAFQFDTMHLDWQARALYRTLLQTAWHLSTRPDLPDNDDQLRQIACGGDSAVWAKHGVTVRAMFTAEAGVLWQKRLREDWRVLSNYRQKQKEHAELQHSSKAKQSKEEQSREEKSKAAATAEPVASHQQATAKPSLSPSSSLSGPSGNRSIGSNAAGANKTLAPPPDDCPCPDSLSRPSPPNPGSDDRDRSSGHGLSSAEGENQPNTKSGGHKPGGQGKLSADVQRLIGVCYEMGCQLPTPASVQALLDDYLVNEIEDALREYAESQTDNFFTEKLFFADGGGAGVIIARRKRAEVAS